MLKLTAELEGIAEAMAATEAMIELTEAKARAAVEHVLNEMAKYAKQNAPFQDQTGTLRRSIAAKMDPKPAASGWLLADTPYAIYLELQEGYWVLQGALDFYAPKIDQMFAGKIRVQQPELDANTRGKIAKYRRLK